MLKIAIKYKPDFVCIVPEKRKEVTTEGGLNLNKNRNFIGKLIKKLIKNKIGVSLFINPNISDIKLAYMLKAQTVELHTGKYCKSFKDKKREKSAFRMIKNAAFYAKSLGLNVHAGHGLTFDSTYKISRIKNISEFNIGHFIISESIFFGLKNTIKKFKNIINK